MNNREEQTSLKARVLEVLVELSEGHGNIPQDPSAREERSRRIIDLDEVRIDKRMQLNSRLVFNYRSDTYQPPSIA